MAMRAIFLCLKSSIDKRNIVIYNYNIMEIVLASNNQHKTKEIKEILPDFDIISMKDAGIDIEIEETGTTFEENARIKAKTITELTGKVALADDSGLCVEALNGAPGVYSARYSGKGDDENNKLLLRNMKGIENRKAYFQCDIVVTFPDGKEILEVGKWHGKIAHEMSGKNGFGYDVLFIPDEEPNKTSAELEPDEKNIISHRGIALQKIKRRLESL